MRKRNLFAHIRKCVNSCVFVCAHTYRCKRIKHFRTNKKSAYKSGWLKIYIRKKNKQISKDNKSHSLVNKEPKCVRPLPISIRSIRMSSIIPRIQIYGFFLTRDLLHTFLYVSIQKCSTFSLHFSCYYLLSFV